MQALQINDGATFERALSQCLGARGHAVVACDSAGDAISAIAAKPFDAILLPGTTEVGDLRALYRGAKLRPVIAFTNAPDKKLIATLIADGVHDFIDLPHNPVEAVERIVAAVDRRNRAPETMSAGAINFELLLEAVPDGIVVVGPDGRIIISNNQAQRLTGYRADELAGLPVDALVPDQVRRAHPKLRESFIENPVVRPLVGKQHLSVKRKDGSTFPADISLSPVAGVNGAQVIATIRDVTERHEKDLELQASTEWLRFALRAANMGIWSWDLRSGVLSWSEETEAISRRTPGQQAYTYQDFLASIHPEDRDAVDAQVKRCLALGNDYVSEYRVTGADGSASWVQAIGQVERDESGVPVRMIGIAQDITARKTVEDAIREGEERFRGAFQHTSTAMTLVGTNGRFLRVNPAACRFWGYEEHELLSLTFQELTYPDDLADDLVGVQRMLNGEIESFQMEKRYVRKDGSTIWGNLSVSLVHDASHAPLYFVSQIQDITERKRTEAALQAAYEEMNRVVNTVSNCIYSAEMSYDGEFRYTYLSSVTERLFGYPSSFFTEDPKRWRQVIHPDDFAIVVDEIRRITTGTANEALVEVRIIRPDGAIRWIHDRVAITRDPDMIRVDGVMTDVTDRKSVETEMAHRALHDSLTGLPNRTLFLDRLSHALVRRHSAGELVGVLFLDLDNFKMVNDGLGHEAGDELLAIVARKLAACARSADTVARMGGDEFVVLVEDLTSASEATGIAERLIAALAEPISISGRQVYIGMSIGIALTGDSLCHPNEILRNADAALYRAKAAGRNRYVVFDPGMSLDSLARLELEADLRCTLEKGSGLVLHYQPVVDLTSGRMVACEVLVRWRHPNRGLLGPDAFIPLAEETGLIAPLEQWVLSEACRQVREWQVTYAPAERLNVSVNLSPRRCREPGVVQQVSDVLRTSGLNPGRLTLEITERVIVDEEAHVTLADLKDLGVRLAIDDFGTGYSSLGYLGRIGADVLKIDRRFVAGMMNSRREAAIVEAVLALGRSLGLSVTAEGIETQAQLNELKRLGCAFGQGYLLGRPAPAEEFFARLMKMGSGNGTLSVPTIAGFASSVL